VIDVFVDALDLPEMSFEGGGADGDRLSRLKRWPQPTLAAQASLAARPASLELESQPAAKQRRRRVNAPPLNLICLGCSPDAYFQCDQLIGSAVCHGRGWLGEKPKARRRMWRYTDVSRGLSFTKRNR
jgi:hypothetical protein